MNFSLTTGTEVLRRTPATLRGLLWELPRSWAEADDGPGSWTPHQVVGHLLAVEEQDWLDRARTILEHGTTQAFAPVDREAASRRFAGWTLAQLLDGFTSQRAANLDALAALVSPEDLARTGLHPTFGEVTLGQLLATWVAHDLNHLGQIVTTMAGQYGSAVGPWRAFLPIIGEPRRAPAGPD